MTFGLFVGHQQYIIAKATSRAQGVFNVASNNVTMEVALYKTKKYSTVRKNRNNLTS